MSDLTGGKFPQANPWAAMLGLTNAAQSNVPARSNAELLGLSTLTDGVIATSTNTTAVAIPVDPGTVITNVIMLIGSGTASSTPTHSFVALYSGAATVAAAALLANSADAATAAITASAALVTALTTPYLVKPSDCPNGFIYAAYGPSATAVPSGACVATPTAVTYQWFTGSTTPKGTTPFLSCTVATTTAGTPNATLTGAAAKAVAPIMILN